MPFCLLHSVFRPPTLSLCPRYPACLTTPLASHIDLAPDLSLTAPSLYPTLRSPTTRSILLVVSSVKFTCFSRTDHGIAREIGTRFGELKRIKERSLDYSHKRAIAALSRRLPFPNHEVLPNQAAQRTSKERVRRGTLSGRNELRMHVGEDHYRCAWNGCSMKV